METTRIKRLGRFLMTMLALAPLAWVRIPVLFQPTKMKAKLLSAKVQPKESTRFGLLSMVILGYGVMIFAYIIVAGTENALKDLALITLVLWLVAIVASLVSSALYAPTEAEMEAERKRIAEESNQA